MGGRSRTSQHSVQPAGAASASKTRLDVALTERGLAESREKAQALIMAGLVTVDGAKAEKAGALVAPITRIEVLASARYVGRGGLKLDAALDHVQWEVRGLVALDVGSSTGGFVDCLLQRGAARVIAVDAGTNQLDWRLRNDPRVRLLEKTNARYLQWEQIGEQADLITMDVSFISATRILPALLPFAREGTRLLVLVKPQFEAGKGQVGKGGIVRDPALHRKAVEQVRECAAGLGFGGLQDFPCAVLGAEGNQEFFLAGTFCPHPSAAAANGAGSEPSAPLRSERE